VIRYPQKSPKAETNIHIAAANVCNLLSRGTFNGANFTPRIFMFLVKFSFQIQIGENLFIRFMRCLCIGRLIFLNKNYRPYFDFSVITGRVASTDRESNMNWHFIKRTYKVYVWSLQEMDFVALFILVLVIFFNNSSNLF